ncbi:hypothetical protein LOTGIDRAFT_232467 [Lottia gigantea]|uniref:Uncharacterized protein n=1 Tax=Lottia gigantea TaxID=225164 RepID=V3ZS02_LOTGI|nr:hypothetical protein LOTGIDRAFT_232467 [Lottia gigantea]ESO94213.1 hypothetical protein LOTGIDRAFT_232467 [Lottia gigantea]
MQSGYGPAYYYAGSRDGSVSEPYAASHIDSTMKAYPSQQSIDTRSYITGSKRSLYSTYTSYTTHTNMSYALPIVTNAPLLEKKPPDNWGLAFVSLFINPIFGLIAILLAEQSKIYFTKCNYLKASQYGVYAKGAALGGIACTIILLVLIIAIAVNQHIMYNI